MQTARIGFFIFVLLASSLASAQVPFSIAATIKITTPKHTGDPTKCSFENAVENVDAGGKVGNNACEPAVKTVNGNGTLIDLQNLTVQVDNTVYLSNNWAAIANGTIDGGYKSHMLSVSGPNTLLYTHRTTWTRGSTGGSGGCILVQSLASLYTYTTVFEDCRASENGGAIAFYGYYLDVEFTAFYDNAARDGGAVWLGGSTSDIRYSTLRGNYAAHAGGGLFNQYTSLRLYGVRIEQNLVDQDPDNPSFHGAGGGIPNSGPLFANLVNVEGNQVERGNGGGLYLQSNDGEVTIFRSRVHANKAGSGAQPADTEFDGGGIYAESRFDVRDSTISKNIAHQNGAGVAIAKAAAGVPISIENTTFVFNEAKKGAALWVTGQPTGKMKDDTSPLGENYNLQVLNDTFAQNMGAEQIFLEQDTPADKEILFVNDVLDSSVPGCGGYVGRLRTKRVSDVSPAAYNVQFPGASCGADIPTMGGVLDPILDGWYFDMDYAETGLSLPADPVVCAFLGDRDQFGNPRHCLLGAVELAPPVVGQPPIWAP